MNTRTLLKTAAYLKAPGKTFAMMHPGKAALLAAGKWAASRAMPNGLRPRPRRSPVGTALKGAAAAAVAVPVGLWLGRRLTRRDGARASA